MTESCFYPWVIVKPLSILCSTVLDQPMALTDISFKFYLLLFAVTNLLEFPFYKFNLKRTLILNLATHPFVIWGLPYVAKSLDWTILEYLFVAEALAFIVEAFILRLTFKYSWVSAFAVAVTANLFSWSVGVWFQAQSWL